jgi:hypothetical protein
VLALDIASETVVAEYMYQFDAPDSYGAPGAPAEMKLSGVIALNPKELLILERTDAVAKLYRVDMSRASNILAASGLNPIHRPRWNHWRISPAVGYIPCRKRW